MRIVFVLVALWLQLMGAKEPEALSVVRDFSLNEKVMPKQYLSNPHLRASEYLRNKPELSSDEKAQITHEINQILSRVALESFCKGGSYSLDPIYEFHEGRQRLVGHQLFLNFSCTLEHDEIARFNALINEMDKMASSSGFFSFSIPSLNATLSAEDIEGAKERGYEKLLLLALEKESTYSKLTKRQCALHEIEFAPSHGYAPRPLRASLKSADSATMELQAPLVHEEDVNVSATASYRCQ